MTPDGLKTWARPIKRDILALYLASRNPRVPYNPQPIDLMPDFIPVIGYLDDLIIVPAAILVTVLECSTGSPATRGPKE